MGKRAVRMDIDLPRGFYNGKVIRSIPFLCHFPEGEKFVDTFNSITGCGSFEFTARSPHHTGDVRCSRKIFSAPGFSARKEDRRNVKITGNFLQLLSIEELSTRKFKTHKSFFQILEFGVKWQF
jgi:hypothetical protein